MENQRKIESQSREANALPVDIETCASEPIHIPGSVQNFGALVAFDDRKTITRASKNILALTGLEATDLIGQPLEKIIENPDWLDACRESDKDREPAEVTLCNGKRVNIVCRLSSNERYIDIVETNAPNAFDVNKGTLERVSKELATVNSEERLADLFARLIRQLTGFDRVKVYKFDQLWNGAVIAESRSENVPSYKGLNFPESDIPKQARELYIRNRIRVIADVNDPQSPLLEGSDLSPLDMSFSFVRSVSPVHLQYLRNMNVAASMSISLFDNGKFWGLIACHHASARTFNLHDAHIGQALSDLFSKRLTELRQQVETDEAERCISVIDELMDQFRISCNLQGLVDGMDELIGSTGAAAMVNGNIARKNAAPDDESLQSLVSWIERNSTEPIYACDDLPSRYDEAIGSYACGVLSARIPGVENAWLLWFRFEITKLVSWAGDPYKPKSESPFGQRLYPRTSFEIWREKRRGHSMSWIDGEKTAARYLAKRVAEYLT